MKETVYFNNGEVYKTSISPELIISNSSLTGERDGKKIDYYSYQTTPIGMHDWFGVKEDILTGVKQVKRYYKTKFFCEQEGSADWYDMIDIDVAPSMDEVYAVSEMGNEIEVFFDIKTLANMSNIAEYYSLRMPLGANSDFDSNSLKWKYRMRGNPHPILGNVKIGSVKFIDGFPTFFKCYSYVPS